MEWVSDDENDRIEESSILEKSNIREYNLGNFKFCRGEGDILGERSVTWVTSAPPQNLKLHFDLISTILWQSCSYLWQSCSYHYGTVVLVM